MMKITRKLIIGLAFIFSLASGVTAQNATMYYMSGVPQSYMLNPATQPKCNIFIGLPVFSSYYVNGYSSSITIDDLVYIDPETNTQKDILYSEEDKQMFLNKLDPSNLISVDMALNLASFGFRVKDYYFSLNITTRFSEQINYPKDLAVLLLDGNANQKNFDLSALGLEAQNYTDWGLNISRSFGDQLSVGVRPKVLFGMAVVDRGSNNLQLETSRDSWELTADYSMKVSAPGLKVPVDEDGAYDPDGEIEIDPDFSSISEITKLVSSNPGLGIDLGVHYKPWDFLQFSVSLIDLGYIKWKNDLHTLSLNGSYKFEGVQIGIGDSTDFSESILDTIKANMNITGSDAPFTSYLNPKLFVGARYFIMNDLDVGLLSRTEFISSEVRQDISILANWRPSHVFGLSASYGLLNGNRSSFGLGMSFVFGPFNLYLISDNLPTNYNSQQIDGVNFGVPLPNDLNSYNFRIGLNLVFGCNQSKKLMRDKPLLYRGDYLE